MGFIRWGNIRGKPERSEVSSAEYVPDLILIIFRQAGDVEWHDRLKYAYIASKGLFYSFFPFFMPFSDSQKHPF